MGDLFWNKLAGVIIGGVLLVMVIMELGHMLVPSHGADELTAENTAYPVDWAALGTGATAVVEEEDTGPVDYGLVLAAADISAGERVMRRCVSCHTVEEGAGNSTGPALWDVVGRTINSVSGFAYSGALPEGDWTYEALDQFLESPAGWAPGTAMNFRGLSNPEQRINVIAYLRSLSNNPAPLPAPLPAADEMAAEAVEDAMGEMADDAAGELAEAVDDATAAATEDAPAEDAPAADPEDNGGEQ